MVGKGRVLYMCKAGTKESFIVNLLFIVHLHCCSGVYC